MMELTPLGEGAARTAEWQESGNVVCEDHPVDRGRRKVLLELQHHQPLTLENLLHTMERSDYSTDFILGVLDDLEDAGLVRGY